MKKAAKWIIRAAGLGILLGLLALPSFAADTDTFTFKGTAMATENGQPIASSYLVCLFQSSCSGSYDAGLSLYLPDHTVEITPTYNGSYSTVNPLRGRRYNVTYYPGTTNVSSYTETDSFYVTTTVGGAPTTIGSVTYNVTITQNGWHCSRRGCTPNWVTNIVDGYGAITVTNTTEN
jgi:hypothetical protein